MVRFSVVCLAPLLLMLSHFGRAECTESMELDVTGECGSRAADLRVIPDFRQSLRLRDLWQLDSGGAHPPLRLPYQRIQRLEIESMWGLGEGESIVSDPRWGYSELQPDLQAIARLLARETAMARSMGQWD